MEYRDLYSGLIKLHILHHAVEEPVYGQGMIEELARHGYKISPGTLYPILHAFEKKGYVKSKNKLFEGRIRRFYEGTKLGKLALNAAKIKVQELFGELFESE